MGALDGFYSTWSKAKDTFGAGTPTDGSQYNGSSSQLLKMKSSIESASKHDGWQGTGADAYAAANKEHAGVYEKLADLDKQMAAEVTNAANIVTNGRTQLDNTKSWVDSAVSSLPSSLSSQARENSLIPIAKEGITQVNNTVSTANGDMLKIGFRVTDIKNQYDELQNQKLGPGEKDEKADGKKEDKGKQAADDFAAAKDGTATPEQLTRLKEAASLTPEQKEALAQGNPTTIPQEQYDYLKSLTKEMGSSDVKEALDHYSGLKYTLGNAMAIMGNPDIQTANGDHGGMAAMPPEVQKTFSDPLLRVEPETFKQLAQSGNREFDPRVLFSHWDDYQTWSNLMGNADPSLMHGNEFNTALMTKMGETVDLMHSTGPWSAEATAMSDGMTDQIQNALNTVGHDQAAVHDVVTGDHGQKFIEDFVTHQWTDNGTALGGLLPETTDHRQLAGETMKAFDSYVSGHGPQLLDIPGTDNQSLGQVNPEFVKALAQANSPYIDDMLGNPLDDTKGFGEPLDGDLTDKQMPRMRDLFAVIDSNKEAAEILNSHAYVTGLQYQGNFEQSIINGEMPNSGDLSSAGTLRGVIDSAANAADNDAIKYGNLQDVKAFESRGKWFEVATTIGSEIPGVKAVLDGAGKIPGVSLQDIFVGQAPTANEPVHIASNSSAAMQHSIAQQLLSHHMGDSNYFRQLGLLDESGNLRPLKGNESNFETALNSYFNGINPAVKSAIEDYEDNVRDALPVAEGHTGS
ncbi:hypothetical protein SAMN04488583_4476 [Mycobacterium sp. 88mf]|nr:hypothetical protein SAMN04488583_4476 [Mycobacterium sp. 88mf]SFF81834.1 hypothetical protein SAMN04488582_104188 [Mycobacterium sp. 455mf]